MEYNLKRTKRKTVSMTVDESGEIQVRAPYLVPTSFIDDFVESHADFIAKRRASQAELRALAANEPEYRRRAKQELPRLAAQYAAKMGVSPQYIKITSAKTRFGSCNAQNGICFSWRVMMYDMRAVEYVVVHELAHIKQKNHSAAFYREVKKLLPDYKERRLLLKAPLGATPQQR